jgi:hypothetical protein
MMLHTREDGVVVLRIKAVPGARRSQIVGVLAMPDGERLKVRIAAPPEDGEANKAICRLIAETLGARTSTVKILTGATSAEKTVGISGLGAGHAAGLDEVAIRERIMERLLSG